MKPDFSYKLTKKALACINDNGLVGHGDCVIAGLSGGADSVCLILLLNEIKKYIDYKLFALHVNHGIRGEAAEHDEDFSKAFCEKLNIPFKAYHVDVPAISRDKGLTLEEAGRIARYECFSNYAKESGLGNVRIALAHHIDDQAETVIFNMIRGSGLKGMGGIDVKTQRGELTVIRPLLFISKDEILKYLELTGQDYCTDETNFSNDYSRNLIRNEVIPKLNKIQPQSAGHISQTAYELREAEEYLQKSMLKLYAEAVENKENSYVIDVKKIKAEEPVIVRYLIIHIIKQLVDTYKDITRTHIEDVYSLINKGKGKHIMLPFGLVAERIKDGICIRRTS